MAECNWPIDKPPDAPAILKVRPGVLNPFNEDAIDEDSIDFQSEDGLSILNRTIRKAFTPNVFKTVNKVRGIMLRIDNPDDPNAPCTAEDVVVGATHAPKCTKKYDLPTYKIRIPEIHFSLPIPNSLDDPCSQDNNIMDTYPSIQADNRQCAQRAVKPGDIVLVNIGNNGSMTKLFYAGPVDSEEVIGPKSDGASPLPQGKCLENYKRIYFNAGASGDPIGTSKRVSKINNGVSPIISGEGISDDKIIAGTPHKKWVVNLFKQLRSEGKYKGIVWAGICQNNGPRDSLGMLSNDGHRTFPGDPGRSTVIYMPTGVDPTSPLEIIYWFHDGLGFANSADEWNSLWADLRGMMKNNSEGARRNFVLVVPEMLWSLGSSVKQTGVPRRNTKPLVQDYGAPGGWLGGFTLAAMQPVYTNREWAAWGFGGIPAKSDHTGKDGSIFDVPISFRSAIGSMEAHPAVASDQLPFSVAGDMAQLHEEVVTLLRKHFGVVNKANTKDNITLVANQKGGTAISNLARMGKLGKGSGQINPKKIVLAHSDYSGFNGGRNPDLNEVVSSALQGTNWYHDNDLYEIIKNIDKETQLEIHLVWKGLPERPRQCAAAFLGGLFHVSAMPGITEQTSFKVAVDELKRTYKEKFWMGAWANPGDPLATQAKIDKNCGKPPLHTEVSTALDLKNLFSEGRRYLEGNKISTTRLRPPFDNVVYKGWNTNTTQGVLGWLFEVDKKDVEPTTSEKKHTKKMSNLIAEPGVTPAQKNIFKNFNGKAILYKSELVGPSKNVSILVPAAASPMHPYELIYYLHGNIGLNGAAKTYQTVLENQIKVMAEVQGRNVVVVLVDIDPTPSSVSSKLWSGGSFNSFHEEVVGQIKAKWSRGKWWTHSVTGEMFNDDPAREPKFFTLKAWSGGSRMLAHAVQNLSTKYIAGNKPYTGGLQRIDFLDANWGIEEPIINTIYNNSKWTEVDPGKNFEIQIVASSVTFPPKNFSAKQLASKYLTPAPEGMAKKGVWVIDAQDTSPGTVPYKYFSQPSKLMMTPPVAYAMSDVATNGTVPTPTQLTFDKEGKAYSLDGKAHPEFNLDKTAAFFKGNLKNQTPETEEMGYPKNYQAECRQIQTTAKNPTDMMLSNVQDCRTNPLGLIDIKSFKLSNITIQPRRKEFTWATNELGSYLKALDDPVWAATSPPTTWIIDDISPQWANGVDKVAGHAAHREGIDVDIALPKRAHIQNGSKPLIASDLDLDKTLVFLILSKLNGAKIFFLDKKFFKPLEKRATFIATDGAPSSGTGKIFGGDPALKPFLKKHLYGKPKFVKELMRMVRHEPGHTSHLHVRLLREWGSHQTRDYPRWAINRLKSLGCNYKGPPTI